jgi:predicted O-linked N-acetylglucosamine transferase (SPINDLY family)
VTDCIAESAETYVELAVRLANDREFRADVGRGISEASPGLFEDVAVVQEIEEFLVGARAAV